tara:strand:+ start:1780 stop:2103 length:324 start_codon:yes stop_codon:yes gene_type:complete
MALPLIPLAVRAGLALAKNKKARELLAKSVGGLFKKRQNLTSQLRQGKKPPSIRSIKNKNFILGAGSGIAAEKAVDKFYSKKKENEIRNEIRKEIKKRKKSKTVAQK